MGNPLRIKVDPHAPFSIGPDNPILKQIDNLPMRPKVMIATPMSWNHVPRAHQICLDTLSWWSGCKFARPNGPTIYDMRNKSVESMFEHQMDSLMFIDADMTFPSDALERIIAHNLPIVSGFCRMRKRPFDPCIYIRTPQHEALSTRKPYVCLHPQPGSRGLMEVDACGGAFLYIRREVLEKIRWPWFMNRECIKQVPIIKDDMLGEDLWFCDRATEAGYKIFVDLDMKIGHITSCVVQTTDDWTPILLVE